MSKGTSRETALVDALGYHIWFDGTLLSIAMYQKEMGAELTPPLRAKLARLLLGVTDEELDHLDVAAGRGEMSPRRSSVLDELLDKLRGQAP